MIAATRVQRPSNRSGNRISCWNLAHSPKHPLRNLLFLIYVHHKASIPSNLATDPRDNQRFVLTTYAGWRLAPLPSGRDLDQAAHLITVWSTRWRFSAVWLRFESLHYAWTKYGLRVLR
jgi:hypothetical protein